MLAHVVSELVMMYVVELFDIASSSVPRHVYMKEDNIAVKLYLDLLVRGSTR